MSDDHEVPSSNSHPGQLQLRSGSPALSHVSDHSMNSPMSFNSATEIKSPEEASLSSVKKRHSKDSPMAFALDQTSLVKAECSSSPAADSVSMADSQASMGAFVDFANENSQAEIECPEEPSLPSEKKRHSKDSPMAFAPDQTSLVKAESSSPPASDGVFMADSHASMGAYADFANENSQFDCDPKSSAEADSDGKTDKSSVWEYVEKAIQGLVSMELGRFRRALTKDCFKLDREDGEHLNEWKKPQEAVLDLTLHFLKQMKQDHLADSLKNRLFAPLCQCQMKLKLKTKFQHVLEQFHERGEPTHLNEMYTELYIIEGQGEFGEKHEITQIHMRPSRAITTLKTADIFSWNEQKVRSVLTRGVAGIGKTLLTQKFTFDWADGLSNQKINFIFPFTFRELNPLREESISLYGLIRHFFTESNPVLCRFEEFQCLFIFDGLDECRLELDFSKAQSVTDVREKTSVAVLLVNIIRGTLLPSALIWITSRPAAANQIPAVCFDRITEVQGFTDPQKEIYFRKRFRDEEQASKVLSHIKASPSVYNMCSFPIFCWITAKVMDDVLLVEEGKLPQTLTELYIHFLVVQAKVTNVKYKDKSVMDAHWSHEMKTTIMLLSKLAFDQLQKGNFIFYESDLADCGINITEASVYSGLFSQMFKEERGMYQYKVFCFVHLSVQEFLAALHVHVTFMDHGVNLLLEKQSFWANLFNSRSSLTWFYKTAVDKTLDSPNGHLDLFLRFLLGLSLEYNQGLLQGLVRKTGSPHINKDVGEYLKAKLDSVLFVERNLMLLQCLNEIKDCGLCEEVQTWLTSEKIPSDLSPAQWSALVSILLSIEEPEFDLTKYQQSETALLMLMPVIKQSTKALLNGCGLSDKACTALASGLSSQCSLRELDLSNNFLKESGFLQLCEGLKSPNCALQTLSLRQCGLTSRSCEALVSVLDSDSHSLVELDLSNNDLQDSGVKTLCRALKKPLCKLETLRLSGCQVSMSGCAALVSALSSGASCPKELDLSYNHPGQTEAKQLTALFQDPQRNISLDHGGEERLQDGFSKYAYHLTFDLNTANKRIKVSDNNTRISLEQEKQTYSDHSERFDYWKQVMCSEGLTGRRYWEVEVGGDVYIAVTYKSIKRRGTGEESCLGKNTRSWSLGCSEEDQKFSVLHQNGRRFLKKKESNRIGVYLDWDGGILSFFEVFSDQKIHLHTIKTKFTDKVYPAFRIKTKPVNSFVTLCKV